VIVAIAQRQPKYWRIGDPMRAVAGVGGSFAVNGTVMGRPYGAAGTFAAPVESTTPRCMQSRHRFGVAATSRFNLR